MISAPQRMRLLTEEDIVSAVVTVNAIATRAGVSPKKVSAITTAASELATNAIKYAGSGILTVRILKQRSRTGVEVVMEDRGPGIQDLERAMKDSFSTGGSLGLGLPGTKRLTDDFSVETSVRNGTSVRAVVWEY